MASTVRGPARHWDMELTNGDLTLRPPRPADAPALVAAIRASLPELQPWMTWASADYDETAASQWIGDEFMPGSESFVMVDSSARTGPPLGAAGLKPLIEPDLFVELGYWVRSDVTGRGLATRATRLLAHHALTTRGARRVELYIATDNRASRRVAEKAGAHHEGVLRDRMRLADGWHDADLFSIVTGDLG